MPVHHEPQPLKTPLLCWHESLASARNDALVALSTDAARIATTRPLAAGTAVYLELEGGAGIDGVATALDSTGFIVEFVAVDDAASVLIARALRDNDPVVNDPVVDDEVAHVGERPALRPAAILSPPVAPEVATPGPVLVSAAPVVRPVVAPPAVPESVTLAAEPERVVVAPVPEDIFAPTERVVVPVRDEVSIADALRFELNDDDDAVVAPARAPAQLVPDFEAAVPGDDAPAPAPIVEPFDDLHSDDLVDAAFAYNQPADTAEQPDFDGAFELPTAEQAARNAANEAAFLANDDISDAGAEDAPRTTALFARAAPADTADTADMPVEQAPPVRASLARSPTASLFDVPHTVPMGSLPPPSATQDLVLSPAALSADAWARAKAEPATAAPVGSAVPPAKETTDKWPVARAISTDHHNVHGAFDDLDVTAPGAHAVDAPTRAVPRSPAVAAMSAADATWKPIGNPAFDDDETHIDPVSASEVTAPAVVDRRVDDVASDDFADGFDVAFTNPGMPALAAMPAAHSIELEIDDDEIELDHRPNLAIEHDETARNIADEIADEIGDEAADRDHFATARPLPKPEPASDDAPRVVDVDFSEFRDVLGATRRVYDALLPSLLPQATSEVVSPAPAMSVPVAPVTTAASLSLPQPPPSLVQLPAPVDVPLALPRPPGSRNTGAFGLGDAENPFGGDTDRTYADSVPPPPPPHAEPWTVSVPPSPAFPAPRLLDADFAPVLHRGGNSSVPRAVPFAGDSEPLAEPPTTSTTTVNPLTPSTPDDLPLVVGDQVQVKAKDLVDDEWHIGPGPHRR
jgi:hypothetical protein